MSDHITKTIDELDGRIADLHREADRLRSMVNELCRIAGFEPKYDVADIRGSGGAGGGTKLTVKPDQFFNKPLSAAVREALTLLRNAGRAPATAEAIYDLLVEGGYAFESRVREVALQGLSISIGKNSAIFVKLNNGLIGLKEWYGAAPVRTRTRNKSTGEIETEESENPEATGEQAAGANAEDIV